jgi:hypothetical protein
MAQNHNAEYIEKPMTRDGRIQGPSRRYRRLRHPTFPSTEWTAKNPLLQRGEIGAESDTHKVKVGDGVTYWNNLQYVIADADGQPKSTADYSMGNLSGGWTVMSTAQQDALNSGATTTNITQIGTNTTSIGNHIADTGNPHQVTASQVGLGNVDNTADLDKPISIATQSALDAKANNTNRVNGAALSNSASVFYGTSSTAAATVQKEVSIPSITTLDTGTIIVVQPTVTSTVANSTLKLNNFDAYPMRYNNAAITTSTDSIVWSAAYPSIWVFDGTYWVFAGHGLDSNTTYTLNYSVDAGQYTAGSGTYAVTRYSILAQKADGTWEKITATNASYSTGTSKSVNTSGFILNQLRYYGTTTAVASGVKIATNVLYEKAASVDMRYSTNCGGTTTWALGDYIYLVGTIGADGLFYLDTTTWWTNALPTTNDGKLYIRLGLALVAASYTMSFFEDRPIFYHDGIGIKEYKVADNKQDVISDLATIRSGASAGATAVQPGDLATVATTGDYDDLLNKPTIPAAQVNSDWDAISGVAQILNKPTLGTAAAANTTDFATAAQGTLASTALQPGDDVSDLNNDAGYQTAGDVATAISGKQDTLSAGTNITITGTTISATDTTYSAFTGATAGDAGTSGLVPAPAAGDQAKFLQGDGTWATPTAATAWGNITGTLSDQTDLQSALSGKADTATTLAGYGITDGANTDLSNLTTTGKNTAAHLAMPSTRYNNLTLGASGVYYTAPADGYFALASIFNTNGYLYMYRGTTRYGTTLTYSAGLWVDSFVPVSKGDSISIQYNGTASVHSFFFIYANGAS